MSHLSQGTSACPVGSSPCSLSSLTLRKPWLRLLLGRAPTVWNLEIKPFHGACVQHTGLSIPPVSWLRAHMASRTDASCPIQWQTVTTDPLLALGDYSHTWLLLPTVVSRALEVNVGSGKALGTSHLQ